MALPAAIEGITLHPLRRPITRSVSALTAAGQARQPHLSRVLDILRTVSAPQAKR
jgi:hypothetical protein